MPNKIVVYTFDGTASGLNGVGGPGVATQTTAPDTGNGGAFPQKLAWLLQKNDPATWEWFPVNYLPYRFFEGTPIKTIYTDALTIVANDIASRPAGTKFVLSGLSLGCFITGLLYNEFRNGVGALGGVLKSRRKDLIGVVEFGSPLRPRGWSIPVQGAIDTTGRGIFSAPIPNAQTYGSTDGNIKYPEWFYLSFNQPGDAASDGRLNSGAEALLTYIYQWFFDPDPADPSKMKGWANSGGSPGTGLIGIVLGPEGAIFGPQGYYSTIGGLNIFSQVQNIIDAVQALLNWALFFIAGALSAAAGLFGGLVSAALNWAAVAINPHTQYDAPWPYKGMVGADSSKGAVQIAYSWCVTNLPRIANPPVATGTEKVCVWEVPGTNPLAPLVYPEAVLKQLPFYVGLDMDAFEYEFLTGYLNSLYPMNMSIHQGTSILINRLVNKPGKFALIGIGQGAAICSNVYKAMTVGNQLSHRLPDCLGIFLFGNPLREAGKTFKWTPASGASPVSPTDIPATSHGVAPADERLTGTKVVGGPGDILWEFASPTDAITCNDATTTLGQQRQQVWESLQSRWSGKTGSLGIVGIAAGVITDMLSFLTPTPGDGVLEGVSVYHANYSLNSYRPVSGYTQTGFQIVVDYLNERIAPEWRLDGWTTTLKPPVIA